MTIDTNSPAFKAALGAFFDRIEAGTYAYCVAAALEAYEAAKAPTLASVLAAVERLYDDQEAERKTLLNSVASLRHALKMQDTAGQDQ